MCNNTEDNGFGEETERFFSPANALTFAGLTAAFATHPEPPGVYALFGNTLIYSARYGMRPAGAPAFAAVTGVVAQSKLAASDAGRLTWEKLADLATITSSTVQYVQRSYYYDKRGRLRQQVETGPLSGTLRTSLRYDYVGSEDRRSVSGTLGGATSTLDRTAFFDSRSRLLRESAILGMKTAAVRHGYDVLGRHKCDTLTATGAAGIVTDTYDIRSQLLTRTAKKSSTTLFEETLRYDSPTRGTAARYAGGLSEVMTLQGSTRNTYGFTYDAAGRLMTTTRFTGTNGTSGSAAYTERNLTYNRNGALLTLNRYGSGTSTAQDDYSYTYSGPLLTGVSGKDDGSSINASFSHDGNGNMTADGRANLTFTYNLLNLPETVTSGNTQTATYHWLADGTKYRVEDASGNGVIYAGDLTYAVTVSGGNTTYALESAEASADGTARFLKNGTAMTPYYTIRDHLGSVRTIVNASGTVVERNDYYPFGTRTTFGSSYATLATNRQKFSGKEDQSTIGSSTLPYLDFGARMYDAKLVRWNTYDPMAEKYYGINPYVYCAGDPVNAIDSDGQRVTIINNRKRALSFLARIAATRLGEERLSALIDAQRDYSLKRVYLTRNAGFSESSREVSYINWTLFPRIDGGSKSPYALLGHEIEHAYRHRISDIYTSSFSGRRDAERKAVGFANYIRKVYREYPLRNRYSFLVGGKEGEFNPVNYYTQKEFISNFLEIGHNNDSSAYGFSYDVSFDEGISVTNYIIIGVNQNNSLYLKKYTDKDEFDKEIHRWKK